MCPASVSNETEVCACVFMCVCGGREAWEICTAVKANAVDSCLNLCECTKCGEEAIHLCVWCEPGPVFSSVLWDFGVILLHHTFTKTHGEDHPQELQAKGLSFLLEKLDPKETCQYNTISTEIKRTTKLLRTIEMHFKNTIQQISTKSDGEPA